MKIILSIILLMISNLSLAKVIKEECPENFTITYYNISRGPLTKDIKNNAEVKLAWESVKEAQRFLQFFNLVKDSAADICSYSNGKKMAYIKSINEVEVLFIPYDDKLYFRTKILSFSQDYIELAVDEDSKKIFGMMKVHSGSGLPDINTEVEIGEAEAVNIQAGNNLSEFEEVL